MGKRGPAPRGEYANKSKVISTRIRQDTRDALEAASKASGRPLSQEIEHRLRRSFVEDERLAQVFGSRRNFALMRTISSVIENLKVGEQDDWMKDSDLFDEVTQGINAVLQVIRPSGKSLRPEKAVADDLYIELGLPIAHAILSRIQNAGPAIPLKGTATPATEYKFAVIKQDLGEIIADRIIEKPIFPDRDQAWTDLHLQKLRAMEIARRRQPQKKDEEQ